jgi:hypothetical protein
MGQISNKAIINILLIAVIFFVELFKFMSNKHIAGKISMAMILIIFIYDSCKTF